jgi:pentatricopeptide repeat protein
MVYEVYQVFELVRLQEWYHPDVRTYIKLLTMLGNCKKPEEAAKLFDNMLEDKVRPTTAIFTALLNIYTKSNLLDKALNLFKSMPKFEGCAPDVYAYTAMIKGCCDGGLYDRAAQLLNEMWWEGAEPNVVTYNTLIFAYGKQGLFDEMEKILTLMDARNVAPDTWTWNSLIRIFGLHNRIQDMEQAYESLLQQGLLPDIVTLNSLVAAYGKNGFYGKMHCVLDYMRRYNYE